MNNQDRIRRITIGSEAPPNVAADHLFRGVLPRRGLVVVLGVPKVGKSLFIMWLAQCLATGRRLLDCNDEQRHRYGNDFGMPTTLGGTLYVAAEDGDIAHKRVAGMRECLRMYDEASLARLPKGDLPIAVYPFGGLRLDGMVFVRDETRDKLAELKQAGFPVRLIVFDTLAAAFAIRDENDNAKMQELVRVLREYAVTFDALVVVVAHPKKNGRRQTGQVRGAGSVTASADAILEITTRKARDGEKRRTIRVASIRDGACEGEKFDFEIGSFGGQPAIHPERKNGGALEVGKGVGQRLTAKQIELLQNLEAWSPAYGALTDINGGQLVYGISLERMVEGAFEVEQLGGGETDKATALRAKDRIRKQIGRDGLFKLVEHGLCERYDVDGKPYFRPVTDWDAMTAHVAALAPGADYKSATTKQRERINQLYADAERGGEAMPQHVFVAFVQAAIRIWQTDSLREAPS